jgi:hypothetical protein
VTQHAIINSSEEKINSSTMRSISGVLFTAFLVVKAIDVRASRLFNTYYLLEPGSYTEPWFSDLDRIELEKTTSEAPLTTTSRRGSIEKKVTNVSLKKNEKKDRRKGKDVVGKLSSYYLSPFNCEPFNCSDLASHRGQKAATRLVFWNQRS